MRTSALTAMTLSLVLSLQAGAANLICWDKYDRSNRKPVLTAQVVADNQIAKVTYGDDIYEGPVTGVQNPRARKYAGCNYYNLNTRHIRSTLVLPGDLSARTSYFYAASYGSDGESGGTQHLSCLVR